MSKPIDPLHPANGSKPDDPLYPAHNPLKDFEALGQERAFELKRFTLWQGVSPQHWIVSDNDFGYDAMLVITGDFVDDHGRKYAEAVAAALNAVDIPTKRKRSAT